MPAQARFSAGSVTQSSLDLSSPCCMCCRYVRFGCFVDGTSAFDAAAFRLAGGEALALDPQARVLLEQTAEALAAAEATFPRSWDAATGVYIGCMYTEYLDSVLGPLVRYQAACPDQRPAV